MTRSLVPLLSLGLSLGACGMRGHPAPSPDPEFVTVGRLAGAQINIGEYARRYGHPPAALADVCVGELARYCLSSRPDSARDGWGTLLAYALVGAEYELRSGGVDRRMNTEDDLVVRSSRVREQVGEVAGCYDMPAPRNGRYPARQVKLDSSTSRPGLHRVKAVPPSPGQWYPLGDIVSIDFLHGRFVAPFVLRPEGDDLVGHGGSPWGWDEQVVLRRIPCPPELAGSSSG